LIRLSKDPFPLQSYLAIPIGLSPHPYAKIVRLFQPILVG
jgi:hypothetical protein